MPRTRSGWTRGLRLYVMRPGTPDDCGWSFEEQETLLDEQVHARSRFRSIVDPERHALYSVHDARTFPPAAPRPPLGATGDHTLVVVREFRRVPLHASGLGLLLFVARPGQAAAVVAALAHFVERAVSAYQPAYLLLARSLEEPRVSALLMGVHECAALVAGSPAAFSVDCLLPEVGPLLAGDPEWYAYAPEPALEALATGVSPYAV